MPVRDADFIAWTGAYSQRGRETRLMHAKALRKQAQAVALKINPLWQVQIRGSLHKGTDIVGSDTDLVVCGGWPATKVFRIAFAEALNGAFQHSGIVIKFNSIAISGILLSGSLAGDVDICFERTEYGVGRLHSGPDTISTLKQNANAAIVVCAFKYLAGKLGKPRLSGSAWEQLVLAVQKNTLCKSVWRLFELVLDRFNVVAVAANLTRWVNVHALDKMNFASLMSQGELSSWRDYSISLQKRAGGLLPFVRIGVAVTLAFALTAASACASAI
ncbi:hypothetical protein HDU90_004696 [Geranomyces variabilis]|nr:hypothetical protein HDU90_004696 [Geranomyces variabilis]